MRPPPAQPVNAEHRPTLELAMIVRNETRNLRRCLASVAPLVDRITIGDTGSTDGTVAVAQSFGATVLHIPWTDDFAAARNRVLENATCDWVLVLDADEVLDTAEAASFLQEMLSDRRVDAFSFRRRDYLSASTPEGVFVDVQPNDGQFELSRTYPGYTLTSHVRLFRNRPEIRFQRAVHEHLGGGLTHGHERVCIAPLTIHHFGAAESTPSQMEEKANYYQQLCLAALAENPDDSELHFQAGITELFQNHEVESALEHFQQAAESPALRGRCELYLGVCYFKLGSWGQAKEHYLLAQAFGEQGGVIDERIGDACFQLGDYEAALESYESAAAKTSPSPLLQARIGLAETQLGKTQRGIQRIEKAIQLDPGLAILQDFLRMAKSLQEGVSDQSS